jgi:hypothetical protein
MWQGKRAESEAFLSFQENIENDATEGDAP